MPSLEGIKYPSTSDEHLKDQWKMMSFYSQQESNLWTSD